MFEAVISVVLLVAGFFFGGTWVFATNRELFNG